MLMQCQLAVRSSNRADPAIPFELPSSTIGCAIVLSPGSRSLRQPCIEIRDHVTQHAALVIVLLQALAKPLGGCKHE